MDDTYVRLERTHRMMSIDHISRRARARARARGRGDREAEPPAAAAAAAAAAAENIGSTGIPVRLI